MEISPKTENKKRKEGNMKVMRTETRLQKRIEARFDTCLKFSEATGITPATLSRLLNGQTEWKMSQIEKAREALNIPAKEIPFYFFELGSPKMEKE